MRLLTADEMRRLDRATIEGGLVPGPELMERAGTGVAEAMERRYGPPLGLRVLVLSGPGNNGGDGFVAARRLRARGATVSVGVLGPLERVRGDARVHLERLQAAGLEAVALDGEADLARLLATRDQWDFALDAVLGTGARGEPEGLAAAAVQALRELDEHGTCIVAVDLPTGVNADTGAIARRAVRADLTVTFGAPKRGHFLFPGRAFAGALEIVDIGLATDDGDPAGFPFTLATGEEIASLLPQRDPRAHKGSVGRVLIAGGSPGLTGAVVLAARAATRSGAGYVQCAVPEGLHDILEVKLTEEMTLPMPQGAGRTLSPAAARPLLARAAGVDALVVGSGLSRDAGAAELARRLVAESPCPVLLDADGLNAFEQHAGLLSGGRAPDPPAAPRGPARAARVLTPHLGEMSRLTGIAPAGLEARRMDVCREWASKWGCVLVLKGAPTVIAGPDGRATVNPTGNPGMATAGMGDVLTGIVAALLAQGLAPYDAARAAVYAHGRGGEHCALAMGPVGFGAGDVVEALPGVFAALFRLRDGTIERRNPEHGGRPAP
jgi:ADP-dependent NAD(P)H-hydrate dehydratase / NAD(P)H-hydrate epimerase